MLRCLALSCGTRVSASPRSLLLLEIYNTLSKRSEPFEPIEDGLVRMYVCGVTPYDVGHLGHALTYVLFDTVRRYLEFQTYEVRHIQNITDVDDDMVRVSRQLEISIAELTRQNHDVYLAEMDALNVLRPDAYPLASQSMPEIIALIEVLLEGGYAYLADGHALFDTANAPDFGALSGRSPAELRDGPRTDMMPQEPESLKRDPLDFLLWQPSDATGASFASPWGDGRPGWHIECSAMARANLGDRIDIHGGGRDLIYPHHESEIAQSQCATGVSPFVHYWMHVGTVTIDGAKMSKSLRNLVKVSELIDAGHTPDAIRLLLLGRHYRAEHPWDAAELARNEELALLLRRASEASGGPADQLRVQSRRNAFMDAMDDDFDTPRAIEVLASISREVLAGALDGATAVPTLVELSGVLGLRLGRED
jgi:cysteinyl-tRNA synthetase